ncbi:MAG: hypothetical protein R3Y64_10795, partial [Peptostreptococcaceae bacterium]
VIVSTNSKIEDARKEYRVVDDMISLNPGDTSVSFEVLCKEETFLYKNTLTLTLELLTKLQNQFGEKSVELVYRKCDI